MNVYCLYCSRLIESCLVRTFDTDVDEIKGRSECLLCQNNYQQIKNPHSAWGLVVRYIQKANHRTFV